MPITSPKKHKGFMFHNINIGRKSFLSLEHNLSKKSLRLRSCQPLYTISNLTTEKR